MTTNDITVRFEPEFMPRPAPANPDPTRVPWANEDEALRKRNELHEKRDTRAMLADCVDFLGEKEAGRKIDQLGGVQPLFRSLVTERDKLAQAYEQEGREAYLAGRLEQDCPYTTAAPGGFLRVQPGAEWLKGWREQEHTESYKEDYTFIVRERTARTATVRASSAAEARHLLNRWAKGNAEFLENSGTIGLSDLESEGFTFRRVKTK